MLKMENFMRGRHGLDGLSIALLAAGFLLGFVGQGFRCLPLLFIGIAGMLWGLARIVSRNHFRRQRENQLFSEILYRLGRRADGFGRKMREIRRYRHFQCPHCGKFVRIPRGKGRVLIHCPQCKNNFYEQS